MSKPLVLVAGLLVLTCCITQPQPQPSPQPSPEPLSERCVIPLDGEWELLRVSGPLDYSQTKNATWENITVPHYLNVWESRRVWYRCTFSGVKAPKTVLAFDSVNFKCIIYVNDQFAGEHTGGYLPFEMDITDHVKDTNKLLVGVEDVGAVLHEKTIPDLLDGTHDNIMYFVGSAFRILGVWQSVSVKTYPSAYVKDVFVKTSYRTKKIELELTVTNEGSTKRTVSIKNEILDEFEFSEITVTLNPSETKKVIVTKEWSSPVLWSFENPHLYSVRTSLLENEEITDYVDTSFGFREFWIENGKFYLNGVPINLRGSSKHLLGDPWTGNHEKDAEETLKRVKAVNSNVLRLHANPYPEVFLDLADEMGVLIIDESAFWCLSHQYDLASDEFWENAQEHIKALVLRDRNHPSLVIWSVENEILLCGGGHEERCKNELIALGDLVKRLDPTRPIMYEGDFDLPNADIINLHYPHEYPEWTVFPNEAYFLDESTAISFSDTEFLWDKGKPLYIGEFLWIPIFSPHPHTIFYGGEAFLNHELYRNKAKGEAWKMYIEAFRSQGVNGYCPWNVLEGGEYPTPLSEAVKEVFQPFFGFIKEYDTHFFSGEEVERTVIVCNDTYEKRDVTGIWSAGEYSGTFNSVLEPAEKTEVTITFKAPHVEKRESFEFSVSLSYDSQVYQIKKVYSVFPYDTLTSNGRIALYDPLGVTKKILDENNIVYELVDTLTVPPEYDLLIVGYHTLKEEGTPTVGEPAHLHFQGNVLCFEQETLSPFGLALTDHLSSMTFERTPVFNLNDTDLRFWQDDNLVSKNDIAKPDSGNYISIVDSGGSGGLEYTSLLEYNNEKGNIVFCQLLVTEKYNTEPMANYMFQKLLEYALNTKWSPRKLGIIGDSTFMDSLNVEYERGPEGVSILLVTEECDPDELRTFVSEGGVAWLHGLEPEQVQTIVAVDFEEISYEDLPVLLVPHELTEGLSHQEFYWTEEREGWWIPLSGDIAWYSISGAETPLTEPCILCKVNYGKGFFIVDTMQWEYNLLQSSRIVSTILTNLGVSMRKPGAIIEAETMTIEEVYLGEKRDHFYGFYTNGYIGTSVTFLDSGMYTISVYAWADTALDKGALLEVLVDRESVGTVEVTTSGVYVVECFVEKGVHEIGIAFTNDYWDPPEEDRNLYVDKLEISYKKESPSFSMC